MQSNLNYKENGFFQRLAEILRTEKQNWWAKHTGTSQSMVSNYWFKGKYPRGDKIAKILELKKISANWLYFGFGPKELIDLDENEIEKKQNMDRQTQIEIIKLAEENIRLKDEVQQMQLRIKQDQLVSDVRVGYGDPKDNIREDNLLEVFALTRMVLDLIIKMAEIYSKDRLDNKKLDAIFDWLDQNKEAKKFNTAAMLRELDRIVG